jgi:hypothetical protein
MKKAPCAGAFLMPFLESTDDFFVMCESPAASGCGGG